MNNLFVKLMKQAIADREFELGYVLNADLVQSIRDEIRNLHSHLVNLPMALTMEELNHQVGPEMIRYLANTRPDEINPT